MLIEWPGKNPSSFFSVIDVNSIWQELAKSIWVNRNKMKESWTITKIRMVFWAIPVAFTIRSDCHLNRMVLGHSFPKETRLDNLSEFLLNFPICHQFLIKRYSDIQCTIFFLLVPVIKGNVFTFFIGRFTDSSGIIHFLFHYGQKLPHSIFGMEFYNIWYD